MVIPDLLTTGIKNVVTKTLVIYSVVVFCHIKTVAGFFIVDLFANFMCKGIRSIQYIKFNFCLNTSFATVYSKNFILIVYSVIFKE